MGTSTLPFGFIFSVCHACAGDTAGASVINDNVSLLWTRQYAWAVRHVRERCHDLLNVTLQLPMLQRLC